MSLPAEFFSVQAFFCRKADEGFYVLSSPTMDKK